MNAREAEIRAEKKEEEYSRRKSFENSDTSDTAVSAPQPFLVLTEKRYTAWSDLRPIARVRNRLEICELAARGAYRRGMSGWILLIYQDELVAHVNVDAHMGLSDAPID